MILIRFRQGRPNATNYETQMVMPRNGIIHVVGFMLGVFFEFNGLNWFAQGRPHTGHSETHMILPRNGIGLNLPSVGFRDLL